jgi:hypothetical protein
MRRSPLLLLLALLFATSACSSAYYSAMYQLGWAKADLLANRIQKSRDAMNEAKFQFIDTCQLFRTAPDAGADHAAAYQNRRDSYGEAVASAAAVRKRRAAVEPAADALFGEWDAEITDSTSAAQRAKRQRHYDEFRAPYDRLLDAMRAAEASLPPVLDGMQAQLAAWQTTDTAAPAVNPADCDQTIRSLQLAIALADQYVAELENTD